MSLLPLVIRYENNSVKIIISSISARLGLLLETWVSGSSQ